jgi:hypothetical protein
LFAFISAFAGYLTYRKSTLPNFTKTILIVIRSLILFIIISLFIEPVLFAIIDKKNASYNIVIADFSRSNNLPGIYGLKSDEIANVLNENFKSSSKNITFFTLPDTSLTADSRTEITPYAVIPESLITDGYKTDPTEVLKAITDKIHADDINTFTLITDGNFNYGYKPVGLARKLNIPFITVGIGDTVQKNDLVLDRVLYNQKAFTGVRNKLIAELSAYNFNDGNIKVQLLREGQYHSDKIITLIKGQTTYKAEFEISEHQASTIKYRLSVENKPGEITFKNNYEDFLIEYLDNKVKLLFISGSPSYDNAFISDVLRRASNYEVIFKTQKNNNDFYEGHIEDNIYLNLSAVFFLNFPALNTSTDLFNSISDKIKHYKIPLIFFSGQNSDYSKLRSLQEFLPFNTIQNINIINTNDNIVPVKLSAISLDENIFLNSLKDISKAPLLSKNTRGILQSSQSSVHFIDKLTGEPILITKYSDVYNSSAFLAYGLWKWRLNSEESYESLAENLIITITNNTLIKTKNNKIKILSKEFFDVNEKPYIVIEVYDEKGNRTVTADVKGSLTGMKYRINTKLKFTAEEGRYKCQVNRLPADDYELFLEAELNGITYSTVTQRIIIDTLNTEYKITKSNFDNLRELAGNTNGTFIKYEKGKNISNLIDSLNNLPERLQQNNHKMIIRDNFWQNKYVLLFTIFFLTIEWIFRKRNNLP